VDGVGGQVKGVVRRVPCGRAVSHLESSWFEGEAPGVAISWIYTTKGKSSRSSIVSWLATTRDGRKEGRKEGITEGGRREKKKKTAKKKPVYKLTDNRCWAL
jgi:hypothetical protein